MKPHVPGVNVTVTHNHIHNNDDVFVLIKLLKKHHICMYQYGALKRYCSTVRFVRTALSLLQKHLQLLCNSNSVWCTTLLCMNLQMLVVLLSVSTYVNSMTSGRLSFPGCALRIDVLYHVHVTRQYIRPICEGEGAPATCITNTH